ncbi:MAG: hypothetical protein ACQETD_05525 [Pseudomonadota bacterium]
MVNLEELSAKELYELARKKEQEEERLAQVKKQLQQLKAERTEMERKHDEALADLDRQIEELKAQRVSMLESQQKALALVDKRLKALGVESEKAASRAEEAKQASAAPVQEPSEELPPPLDEPEPEKEPPARSRAARSDEEMETLKEHIRKMMKGRSYISDGLLREKLQAAKFKPTNLGKMLENLTKQGWLIRRSGGNYVLGRASKKKS